MEVSPVKGRREKILSLQRRWHTMFIHWRLESLSLQQNKAEHWSAPATNSAC